MFFENFRFTVNGGAMSSNPSQQQYQLVVNYLKKQRDEFTKIQTNLIALQTVQLVLLSSLSEADPEIYSRAAHKLSEMSKGMEINGRLHPELAAYFQLIIEHVPQGSFSELLGMLYKVTDAALPPDGDLFQ